MTNVKHLLLDNRESLYKATVIFLLCTILSIMIFHNPNLNEKGIEDVLMAAKKVGKFFDNGESKNETLSI